MKTCDEDSDNATTENEVIEDVIIKGVEDDMKPSSNKKIAGFKDEIVATKTADQDVKKQCVGGQDLEQDIISHKYDVRDENNCDTPTKLSGIIHKDTANLGRLEKVSNVTASKSCEDSAAARTHTGRMNSKAMRSDAALLLSKDEILKLQAEQAEFLEGFDVVYPDHEPNHFQQILSRNKVMQRDVEAKLAMAEHLDIDLKEEYNSAISILEKIGVMVGEVRGHMKRVEELELLLQRDSIVKPSFEKLFQKSYWKNSTNVGIFELINGINYCLEILNQSIEKVKGKSRA